MKSIFSRYARIFLASIFIYVIHLSVSPTPSQALDCLYTVSGECIEDIEINATFFVRYFVVAYEDDCTVIYDAFIRQNSLHLFDSVTDPIRRHSPNLQQHNASLFIKAQGELKMHKLEDAINNGNASIMSMVEISRYCGGSWEIDFDEREYPDYCLDIPINPPDPPFAMTAIDALGPTFYSHLQLVEPECAPIHDPAYGFFPEQTEATFLIVDIEHEIEILDQLGIVGAEPH